MADIFTKGLGSDKLQHVLDILGIQHLNVSQLKGRMGRGKGGKQQEKAKTEQDVESTEEVDTFDRVGTSGSVRDRANLKKKARTKTWSDVVKGLKTDDKSETSRFG